MASTRQHTDRVVIHMAETNPREAWPAARIRAFHMAPKPRGRGWSDIGYNKYIRRDGTVEDGRGWDLIGAHAEGWNATSVGICLEGGAGAQITDRFEDHFTPEQGVALRALLDECFARYGELAVYGHKDCPSCAPEKQCPGFDVTTWLTGAP